MATIIKMGNLALNGRIAPIGSSYKNSNIISILDSRPEQNISWVVVNGLLIADRCLLTCISWNDIHAQGLVFGKELCIDGAKYLCRLLKVGKREYGPNEWDAAIDVVNNNSNDLWHWRDSYFWGQEMPRGDSLSAHVIRGVSSSRGWDWLPSSSRDEDVGFRPALEPVFADRWKAEPGTNLQVWGIQSVIRGQLVDANSYDLVLLEQSRLTVNKKSLKSFALRQRDGQTIVDRSQIVGIQLLE